MHLRRAKKSSASSPLSSPSKNTNAVSPSSATSGGISPASVEGRWQPLRSARKAIRQTLDTNTTTDATAHTGTTNVTTTNTAKNDNNTAQAAAATTQPQSQLQSQSKSQSQSQSQSQSESIPAYSDNFTFAPIPDFVPISSCDDIPEPDFNKPIQSDLKMSNNFSKLITNAKKVDQVRAQVKRAAQPKPDVNLTIEDILHSRDGMKDGTRNKDRAGDVEMSVEEAQKRLIEQLKQGLKFLTQENKDLNSQRNDLEQDLKGVEDQLKNKDGMLKVKAKEVEERNLKLAVLEHHFRILNNVQDDPVEGEAGADAILAGTGTDAGAGTGTGTGNTEQGGEDAEATTEDEQETTEETSSIMIAKNHVAPTAQPSIIQIDKGYYMQLEATVKQEIAKREKVEQVNESIAMKYAMLEKESQKQLVDVSHVMETSQEALKEQVSRQERTIQSLEGSLNKSRELLFKKNKKSHKRRATVSALPTAEELVKQQQQQLQQQDHDEHSLSEATMGSAPTDTEHEEEKFLEKQVVKDAITDAVNVALGEQEVEHHSLMNVLSKQVERKDKHISSLETKMFSLLKNKNDGNGMSSPQRTRAVPQDVMIRNMAVTNELLDTSMRKLENMMSHIDRVSDENHAHIKDEIAPIRRVATKISLVHEEMSVSMKLLEQKIHNGAQTVCKETEVERGQSSGDDVEEEAAKEKPNMEEMMEHITRALKETESSIREEIRKLNDHLETIQSDLEAKNDTIEGLELAIAEHVESYLALQKEYEVLDAKSI
mmetsp:Transcript_3568/g.5443  ORF Transcript_3568/g.5443 Transcript_3568/m.5443 type:complete len:768 (-) Transcript_3568:80-2383(-)